MLKLISRIGRDRRGSVPVEYVMIGILVSVTVIAGATLIGASLDKNLHTVANNITSTAS